jgi:hypothetical protein
VLVDWNIRAVGKANVVNEIEKIFASAITMKITLFSFFKGSDHTYAIHILIMINEEEINVIDVISFDSSGKIIEINALKLENFS